MAWFHSANQLFMKNELDTLANFTLSVAKLCFTSQKGRLNSTYSGRWPVMPINNATNQSVLPPGIT